MSRRLSVLFISAIVLVGCGGQGEDAGGPAGATEQLSTVVPTLPRTDPPPSPTDSEPPLSVETTAPIPSPTDPQEPDDDDDGIPNTLDNCEFDSNPGQEDGDGDGKGDVCDEPVTPGDCESSSFTAISTDLLNGTMLVRIDQGAPVDPQQPDIGPVDCDGTPLWPPDLWPPSIRIDGEFYYVADTATASKPGFGLDPGRFAPGSDLTPVVVEDFGGVSAAEILATGLTADRATARSIAAVLTPEAQAVLPTAVWRQAIALNPTLITAVTAPG